MKDAKVVITVKGEKVLVNYYGHTGLAFNALCCEMANTMASLVAGGAFTEEEAEEGFQRIKERYQHDLIKMRWEAIHNE